MHQKSNLSQSISKASNLRILMVAGMISAFSAVVIAIIPTWKFIHLNGDFDINMASSIGEYVGGTVGSLLSFSGILLLLQTIRDQQDSIKISQEALISQSEELKATRLIHHEEQFGSIFFQLLNAYNELVKSFETPTSFNKTATGKNCLKELYYEFKQICRESNDEKDIIGKFNIFVRDKHLTLKQFNQSLEMVLTLTMNYELDIDLKKRYANFISAQLSYHEEFFLLMYLNSNPNSKFSMDDIWLMEIFDFDPESPFEFLTIFNFNKITKNEK